ncbi:MAG: hypothetical protein KDC75_04165, partial [Phaeodactylibacter sp.]|nr:hypothetical protein [Phaeodactylibacter sp.]
MPATNLCGRQTDSVAFTVLSEGQEIDGAIRVHSIAVSKEANRVATATILISDGDVSSRNFPVSNREEFIPGKNIVVRAGYHAEEGPIFSGIVVGHRIK